MGKRGRSLTNQLQHCVLESFAPGQRVIAFNIGASWASKRWPDSSFAACADRFIERRGKGATGRQPARRADIFLF